MNFNYGKDAGIWNVNAIEEFEKFHEIELHIICAIRGLSTKEQNFDLRGIHYHCFREQDSSLFNKIKRQLFTKNHELFTENRTCFSNIIARIQPQIVHIIGAENPYYSLAALDVPDEIITIVQLQALLVRLVDVTNNPDEKKSFAYKGELERKIIRKADYIGTKLTDFVDYIHKYIKPDAKILDISLAMGQKIDRSITEKKYDFVYWAANINKAGDVAVESFIIAFKQNPLISLDIIGDYSEDFKSKLMEKLKVVGADSSVTFEGLLPTHDDVIRQIRKSRIALLPLTMDFVPNTLHEAMANGLPVITTRTDGTPRLNRSRNTVCISEQGDFLSMANNMLEVLGNDNLYCELQQNGYLTESEYDTNEARMKGWLETYKKLCENNV